QLPVFIGKHSLPPPSLKLLHSLDQGGRLKPYNIKHNARFFTRYRMKQFYRKLLLIRNNRRRVHVDTPLHARVDDRLRLHEKRRLNDLQSIVMRDEVINTFTAVSPTSHQNTGIDNRISRGGRSRAIPVVLHHRISRITAERITDD